MQRLSKIVSYHETREPTAAKEFERSTLSM